MLITANGKPVEISGETSITKLLEEIKVDQPEYVSVQLNGEMLLRANFDTALVKEGAVVEFLYYMGGGQAEAGAPARAPALRRALQITAASGGKAEGGSR
ncbi:MAG: sulfur carrier protein ThiS [Treponema sp.]|jgi:sulfur carrier protein|nr:sulfur carrier protein ThiS [Treponema sp.]